MTPIRMIQYPPSLEASRRRALGLPPRRNLNRRRLGHPALPWELPLLLLIVAAAAAFVWLSL